MKFWIESDLDGFLAQDDDLPPWMNLENHVYSLAISGRAFNYMMKENKNGKKKIFKIMLQQAKIFARMKPNDKTHLIQNLKKYLKNSFVGMCGDGANDCGALKQADVGISLSGAEASIAAHFTSKINDISCVTVLLR